MTEHRHGFPIAAIIMQTLQDSEDALLPKRKNDTLKANCVRTHELCLEYEISAETSTIVEAP